jgi:hypothetical protein
MPGRFLDVVCFTKLFTSFLECTFANLLLDGLNIPPPARIVSLWIVHRCHSKSIITPIQDFYSSVLTELYPVILIPFPGQHLYPSGVTWTLLLVPLFPFNSSRHVSINYSSISTLGIPSNPNRIRTWKVWTFSSSILPWLSHTWHIRWCIHGRHHWSLL